MLLLKENPLESAEAWNSIDVVILHGKPIERSLLSAAGKSSAGAGAAIRTMDVVDQIDHLAQ